LLLLLLDYTSHRLHRCGLLLQMSHVAWSVCLGVSHTDMPCKNEWTDRDAVWGTDSVGPKKPYIRWGRDPNRKEQFWGVVWKALRVSAAVHAAKGIIQSSITAGQPIAMLPTGRCHCLPLREKSVPLWCGRSPQCCENMLLNCQRHRDLQNDLWKAM